MVSLKLGLWWLRESPEYPSLCLWFFGSEHSSLSPYSKTLQALGIDINW